MKYRMYKYNVSDRWRMFKIITERWIKNEKN